MDSSQSQPPQQQRQKTGINLLVCASCDHPLCAEADIAGARLEMPAAAGFAYELEDVFEDVAIATAESERAAAATAGYSQIGGKGIIAAAAEEGLGGGAPWCYRANLSSDISLNTRTNTVAFDSGAPQPAAANAVSGGSLAAIGGQLNLSAGEAAQLSVVSALSRALAPVSDEDTVSLMREGIAFGNGTGEITSTMQRRAAAAPNVSAQPTAPADGADAGTNDASNVVGGRTPTTASSDEPNSNNQPESPTGQRLREMLIPPVIGKTTKASVDLIRARADAFGPSAVVERPIHAGDSEAANGIGGIGAWFAGYAPTGALHCASCSAALGWSFAPHRRTEAAGSDATDESKEVASECSVVAAEVPAAVRANPFGRGARPTFGNATATAVVASASPLPPPPPPPPPFLCLLLKHIKRRGWGAKDVAKQCLVAAAVARRQALDLLRDASPAAIAAISVASPTTANVPSAVPPTRASFPAAGDFPTGASAAAASAEGDEEEDSDNAAAALVSARGDGTLSADEEDAASAAEGDDDADDVTQQQQQSASMSAASVAEAIAAAGRESARQAEVRAILEEDTVSRRRLEALMNSRVNEAVDERTRHLRMQADLVVTLLEKHKEQTMVLSQLLRGQKEKLRQQEEKIETYEAIFVAHKRQLDTQTKHIGFQDDLMRTLKVQVECQQKQIDSQQTILKDQNGTIHKQNGHVREMQSYLRGLVESQVRMKRYLEAIAGGGGGPPPTAATAAQATAGESDSSDQPLSRQHFEAPSTEEEAVESSPSAAATSATAKSVIVASAAKEMLADLAVHETLFGINYSSLGPDSIAGRAMGCVDDTCNTHGDVLLSPAGGESEEGGGGGGITSSGSDAGPPRPQNAGEAGDDTAAVPFDEEA